MNLKLEAKVDGAASRDPELDACIAEIEPAILALKQQGMQATTIIAAMARLTVVAVRDEPL